jgi:hypothetical protein
MTTLYQDTKVVEAAKDWRVTDKAKIAAPAGGKDQARATHRYSEQKLRAAVDELAKKGGQP